MSCEEEASEILEYLVRRGVRISRRRLADWHRAGLLSTPRKVGAGRGAGSVSYYPRGTSLQAFVCAELHQRGFDTEDVGWGLWLRGFDVDPGLWRGPLVRAGQTITELVKIYKIEDPIDELPTLADAADDVLSQAAQSSKKLKFLRRRLKSALIDMLAVGMSVLIGAFQKDVGDGDLVRTLGRLLGTVQPDKKTKRHAFTFLPIEGETLAEHLQFISAAFRQSDVNQIIQKLQVDEAALVRDELLFLHHTLRKAALKDAGPGRVVMNLIDRIFTIESRRVGAAAISIWLVAREVPDWQERLGDLRSRIAARETAGALEGVL